MVLHSLLSWCMVKIMDKKIVLLFLSISMIPRCAASSAPPSTYVTDNKAYVSFDVSMPIDSTGYTLKANNLTGGTIQYQDQGSYISPLLAYETGKFEAPIVNEGQEKSLIKTDIAYSALKFINPNGINNLFIKVGMGSRTQRVSGLDPTVLKDGVYTWKAPIFAYGTEHDTVDRTASNLQLMQVGSINAGPAKNNMMYTQDFYVYSRGLADTRIPGQPLTSDRAGEVLTRAYQSNFSCQAEGLWGAGGDDPYRTVTGVCQGAATTIPAGPNLDYEYGSFTLPVVHTPWTATPDDSCLFPGDKKPHKGCVNAKISLNLRYMARKIRVPINSEVTLFAEYGTVYRNLEVNNLRYVCKGNVYLKGILDPSECLKKSYISGGASYPYFAVGYEVKDGSGVRYSARYINIPGQENGNRLAWLDASNTQIYAVTASSDTVSAQDVKINLNAGLQQIQAQPEVYKVLGDNFLVPILKKNKFLTIH